MAYLPETGLKKAGWRVRTFSRVPQNRQATAVICLFLAAGTARGQQPATVEPQNASRSAMIQAAGQSSGPAQEMRVKVDYATIDGLPIPSHLNIEVVGTGVFNLDLNGCQTIRASK
jgi:hypothetical protein